MNTNTTKRGNSTAEDKFDKIVDKYEDQASELKNKASDYLSRGMAGAESVRDSLTQVTERITQNVEDAVEKGLKTVRKTSAEAESLVKKYPLSSVAGVAAVAFVAGMLLGKSRDR